MNSVKNQRSQSSRTYGYYFALLLFAVVLSTCLGRSFNIFYPEGLAPDISVYSIMGKALLDGQSVYVDIWDHKGPLLYLLYALANFCGYGTNYGTMILQSISTACFLIYSYKLAALFLPRPLAYLTPFILPLFLGTYNGNPSDFILSLQLISLYYFIHKHLFKQEQTILPVLCVCATATLLIRFNICAFFGPFIIAELFYIWRNFGIKHCLIQLCMSSLLCAILMGATVSFFDLNSMFDAYFKFNFSYAKSGESILLNPTMSFFSGFLGKDNALEILYLYSPVIYSAIGIFLFIFSLFAWPKSKRLRLIYCTTITSLLLTLYAIFAGPFYYLCYYVSLHPFYVLSLIFIFYYISKACEKNTPKYLHLPVVIACILASICFLSIKISNTYQRSIVKQSQNNQLKSKIFSLIGTKSNILVINRYHENSNIYVQLERLPVITHFYHPPVPDTVFPYLTDEVKKCIKEKRVEYILRRKGSQLAYQEVLDDLERNGYIHIKDIVDNGPSHSVYHCYKLTKLEN